MAEITLGGNPVHTSGNLPAVGSTAPAFDLIKSDLSKSSSSDYSGKKMVLNIFPSVDTGVCAASIRQFNQAAANLDNTAVLCISMDLPFAQARFCGAEGIENVETLSAFRDNQAFANAYGVGMVDGKFEGLLARAVVVTNESGEVVYTELVPEIGQEPDYDSALAAV